MLKAQLKKIVADTSGATAVEYGLIISLIVLAMVGALQGVASATIDMWANVEEKTTEATGN
jgi:pilus assembly protein Flp/PilA